MFKNFITNLISSFFEFQNKILEKKYGANKFTYKTSNSMSKNHISSGVNLTLDIKLKEKKKEFEDKIKAIAKEHFEDILSYIKSEGAEIHFIKKVQKFLNFIDEKEGFILPKKGLNALYLNLFLNKKIGFKTPIMFIFEYGKLSKYKILYNFYLYQAYKHDIPASNRKKKLDLNKLEDLDFSTFNFEDIMNLKYEIMLEKDALQFSLNFIKEVEGRKNAYNAFKDNGANL